MGLNIKYFLLKANGFRWSPKASAWQRQLNSNAIYAADTVSSIKPLTGERVIELQRNFRKEERKEAQPEYIYKAQEEVAEKDTFQIYQLKRGENIRESSNHSQWKTHSLRQAIEKLTNGITMLPDKRFHVRLHGGEGCLAFR